MAKSGQTFNKKEKEKQRAQHKQEKREKMEERKAQSKKGAALEDMMAYLDENGNLVSTPPDPKKRIAINAEDITIGVPQQAETDPADYIKNGTIDFFNSAKGFGFIKETGTGNSIFFHQNDVDGQVKEGNRVQFEVRSGARGPAAVNVQKLP